MEYLHRAAETPPVYSIRIKNDSKFSTDTTILRHCTSTRAFAVFLAEQVATSPNFTSVKNDKGVNWPTR